MALPAPCTQAGGQELVISGITKETAQGSQGTQADDQGLIVTGITGRTAPNTQYTEAGNQEMLVTGVKRKAVEPIAFAGLSQAATTEGSEVAKFGSDGTPSSQGVLNFIAHKYFQTVDTTKPEELNGFLQYSRDVRKVLVLDAQSGSLILIVQCSSLEILDALWDDYCTGYLNAMAQKFLVPEEVLKAFDLTELKLSTTIAEGDYRTARECFLQGSGGVMQIFVKDSTRYTVSLKVKPSDSIETVKQMVQIQGELFPQGELRLIFSGRELEDNLTIGAYGIRRNSTLHLRYEYNLDRILVNVELPYGSKICFDSSPCDDIENLKKRIYEETGTPVTTQHLSLVGKEVLEDHQLLSEFDNQTELTLRLHEKQCISEFLLFVVTLSGKTKIALNAVLSDTVIDIKRKITNEIGIPADHQQLLLNDQFLADENTLASYYITRDSIIVLDVRKYHSNDMYVFVKAQNGIKWRVEVLAGETIKNLKKRIKNQIGVPVNEQLIMFGDYELEGEHTLRDYGIQSGSTLFMVTNPETHKRSIVS